jgi:lysylphosphatidylglycerol synthetase-like protein (DUF2156 family)
VSKILVTTSVLILALLGLSILASTLTTRVVEIRQAQGVIKAARAAQDASKAAQIASAGLSMVPVMNSLLLALMVIVLIAIAGMIAYALVKHSAPVPQSFPQPSRKQLPPRLPDQNQLMTMLLIQQLRNQQLPKSETPILLDEHQDTEYLGW